MTKKGVSWLHELTRPWLNYYVNQLFVLRNYIDPGFNLDNVSYITHETNSSKITQWLDIIIVILKQDVDIIVEITLLWAEQNLY